MTKYHTVNLVSYGDGRFITLPEIDPHTGEYKIRAVANLVQPGEIHEYPDHVAAELVPLGAIRLPTERELQLHLIATNGGLISNA